MLGSSSAFWPAFSTIVSAGISLLLDLALLVLALTAVRKRSPTGGLLMTAAAAVQMLVTIASPLAYAGAARVGSGVESFAVTSAILGVTLTLVRGARWVLLLAGIYKTAVGDKAEKERRSPGPLNPSRTS